MNEAEQLLEKTHSLINTLYTMMEHVRALSDEIHRYVTALRPVDDGERVKAYAVIIEDGGEVSIECVFNERDDADRFISREQKMYPGRTLRVARIEV